MKEVLEKIGLVDEFAATGFFGAVVTILKRVARGQRIHFWSSFASLMMGVITANYITPLFVEIFSLQGKAQFGVAFLCGYLGYVALDGLWRKLDNPLGKNDSSEPKD